MIICKRVIPAANILVQVPGFDVKRCIQPVTNRQVEAVLVKKFSIYSVTVSKIQKHLILQCSKHSFGKSFLLLKRKNIPDKIAETVGISVPVIFKFIILHGGFTNKSLFQPATGDVTEMVFIL